MNPRRRKTLLIVMVAAIVIFSLSRLLSVDADPSIFKRFGDVGDEGYWVHEARNHFRYGKWIVDEQVMALATAPLYVLASRVVFEFFNVSIASTRYISVTASMLTVLAMFLLIKPYSLKMAVVASFLLSIAEVTFMYSRLGFLETSLLFLVLCSFLMLSKKSIVKEGGEKSGDRKQLVMYFLGGIFLGLAFLTKITIIYLALVYLTYFGISLYRREISIKDIVAFGLGGSIVVLPWVLIFFLPNVEAYSLYLDALSEHNYTSPLSFLSSPFLSFSVSIYALISTFIFTVLTLIYFVDRKLIWLTNSFRTNLAKLHELEIIGLSIFFGYGIVLITTDMVPRRFLLFVIPLILFSSMAVVKDFKTEEFTKSSKLSLFSIAGIVFLVLNALYYPIIAFAKVPPVANILSSLQSGIDLNMSEKSEILFPTAVLFGATLILALCMILPIYYLSRKRTWKVSELLNTYLPYIAVLSVFAGISMTLLYSNYLHLGSILNSTPMFIGLMLFIVIVVVVSGMALLRIKWVKEVLVGIFVVYCIANIGYLVIFPKFSIREAGTTLGQLTESNEWFMSENGHQMALSNDLKPLLYAPNENGFKLINVDGIEKYKPLYVIEAASVETGNDRQVSWVTRDEIDYESNKIGEFQMYEMPGGNFLVKYTVYQIDYSSPK